MAVVKKEALSAPHGRLGLGREEKTALGEDTRKRLGSRGLDARGNSGGTQGRVAVFAWTGDLSALGAAM